MVFDETAFGVQSLYQKYIGGSSAPPIDLFGLQPSSEPISFEELEEEKKIGGLRYNCLNFLSFVVVCILVAGCHRKYYGNLFTQCKGRRGISCQKRLVRMSG